MKQIYFCLKIFVAVLFLLAQMANAEAQSCTPPAPEEECTPPSTWTHDIVVNSSVTWASLGIGDADNVTEQIRITGTGKVTVQSVSLMLKSSSAVVYIDGPELVIENGNLQVDEAGARFLMTNGILRTYGNIQQQPNSVICIIGSIVDCGEEEAGVDFVPGQPSTSADFQNDGGYRFMEEVCINITHDCQLQSTGSGTGLNGVDVWINCCVEVGDRGENHATPTAIGDKDDDDSGNWQNSNNQFIYGTDIVVANGNYQTSNNIMLLCGVGVKVNVSGSFQVNSGTLAGEDLCVAVEDIFENSGTWTLTGINWYSEIQNSTNVPGAGAETSESTILSDCFQECCSGIGLCEKPANASFEDFSCTGGSAFAGGTKYSFSSGCLNNWGRTTGLGDNFVVTSTAAQEGNRYVYMFSSGTTAAGSDASTRCDVTGLVAGKCYEICVYAADAKADGLSSGLGILFIQNNFGPTTYDVIEVPDNPSWSDESLSTIPWVIYCYKITLDPASTGGTLFISASAEEGGATSYIVIDNVCIAEVDCDTEPCTLSLSGSKVDISCFGEADGTIDITVSGGSGTQTYLWNDGATTEDRTGLQAGSYSVIVTDSEGCSDTQTFTISEPAVLDISGVVSDVTTPYGSDGSIDVTVSGGTAPYTYDWSDLPGSNDPEDRTNLQAGTYTVTVTDANGCSAQANFTVNQPGCLLAIYGLKSDVTCHGDANGSIDLVVVAAQGAVTYQWNDGSTDEDRTGLAAGTYSVYCADETGCNVSLDFTISEPAVLGITGSVNNVTVTGGSDGSVDVTASGGTSPYSYLWNDGSTDEDRTGLAAGTYTVTITDAGGCVITQTFTISEPAVLGITGSVNNVTVTGGSDGSIDVTASGGTSPYSYLWNDGSTDEDRTGLSAGTYTVTVTDANGCSAQATFTVYEPACEVSVESEYQDVSCFGEADGTINITVSSGSGTQTYLWNDGSTDEDRTGLAAGTYTVTITDAGGCVITQTFTISEPAVLEVSETHINVSVIGGNDGSIDLTVSGGTGPYTYQWNDGSTDEDRTGLSAGVYTVMVTDANGCTATKTIVITEPDCICTVPANIVITEIGNNQIQVCWDAQPCAIAFVLEYQWKGHQEWKVIEIPDEQNCGIIDLKGHVKVNIRVKAICVDGSETAYSQTIKYEYSAPCTPPSNLAASDLTPTSANLSWTIGTTTGIQKLQYSKIGFPSTSISLGSNVSSYTLYGLSPSSTYKFKVKGDCWSTGKSFTTPAQKLDELSSDPSAILMNVYPNPATDYLQVNFTYNGAEELKATIQLINSLGQIMFTQPMIVSTTSTEISLTLPQALSSGIYSIRVIGLNQPLEKRVLINTGK
jgi:hypothetical protein